MTRPTREQLFWDKVNKHGPIPPACPELGPCWLWTASVVRGGYGLFKNGSRAVMAHKYSLSLAGIDVGDSLACHKCDVAACVNPRHLFLGTQSQNLMDCSQKGRIAKGERNGNSKLNEQQIMEIRRKFAPGLGQKLAVEYGVNRTLIHNIVKRKTWTHV